MEKVVKIKQTFIKTSLYFYTSNVYEYNNYYGSNKRDSSLSYTTLVGTRNFPHIKSRMWPGVCSSEASRMVKLIT